MADDALKALFDVVQVRPKKLMNCARCGNECMRSNNRQKNCLDCGRIVENERRRYGESQIGEQMVCQHCKQECLRTGRSQKFCKPCVKVVADEKYRIKYASLQAANDIKIVGETVFGCGSCGVQITYKGGHHKWCDACVSSKRLDQWREYESRQPKSLLAHGIEISCEQCGYVFPRIAANQKYCSKDCGKAADANGYAERAAKHREKRKLDPAYILSSRMSSGIYAAIRQNKAGRRWESILGFTLEDLVIHLERQFSKGMSWENIGKWHVDHIVPKASFSFTTTECPDFKRCWALTNLQPLWAIDNLKKHAKLNYQV